MTPGTFAMIPIQAASVQGLGATDYKVLIAIAGHINAADGQAYPSLARIAALTGIAREHIPRSIRRLEAAGLLQHQRRADRTGAWDRNTYQINYVDLAPSVMRSAPAAESSSNGEAANEPLPSKRRSPAVHDSGAFEEFWRAYPPRGAHTNPRDPAREKFEAAVRRGVDPAEIVRGAQNYRASIKITATEPRYVKQAVTWLNQKLWADYQRPPEAPRPKAGVI